MVEASTRVRPGRGGVDATFANAEASRRSRMHLSYAVPTFLLYFHGG